MRPWTLDRRAREYRQRQLVRAWEYRQRHLAHGVWYRLRRVLADARDGYAISRDDAAALEADGFRPEPAGHDVAPPLALYFVPEARIGRLQSARPLAVGLSADLLSAGAVALIRFEARTPGAPEPRADASREPAREAGDP